MTASTMSGTDNGRDGNIRVERDGAIATVVLDRPHKLNALTRALWRELGETIATLSADDELRCIVLRGAGERAFSPGNDIGEFAAERANKAQAREYGATMHETLRQLSACRHPLVAQIHGICVGGGLEIAACADIRICGAGSRFGVPVNQLGLVMAYAEMAPLVELVGRSTALEILLEGRVFDAAEARDKGLITRVVADGEVAAEALACARRIADGAPLAARWHKQFARRLADPAPLTDAERDICYDCFDSEDFRIGSAAFLAKTKPRFVGR
jgi:enoyl-CoA hydratase